MLGSLSVTLADTAADAPASHDASGRVLIVIAVAIAVGWFCRSRGIGSALPLIVAGFLLALVPDLQNTVPDPELMLSLVLSPLVFAAGLASSALDLKEVRRTVLILAVGLVLVTTVVIGVVASGAIAALPLAAACALGAVLAPTDAVAAAAVAKSAGLPRRVKLIVEGESLANDGTALTFLRVAIVAAVVGTVSVLQATGILLLAVVGGVAVGGIGGLFVAWLMKRSNEPVVANAILLITPFVIYEATELIGGSGLLAVVIAGILIAHMSESGTAYEARLQANAIWSLIRFLFESTAFVLVGLEFWDTAQRVHEFTPLVVALLMLYLFVVLLVTRALFMGAWFLIGRKVAPKKFSDGKRAARQFAAITVLGVRGPVSVLAVFSLPDNFPERDLLMTLTFGVVILSLIFALAAAPIVRFLNLQTGDETQELRRARKATATAALARLDQIVAEYDSKGEPLSDKMIARLRSLAVRRVDTYESDEQKAVAAKNSVALQRKVQKSMLEAERAELQRIRRSTGIPGDVTRQMLSELDIREAALRTPGRIGAT